MVNPMVERATSDMLIGPDWAMNLEICDILNRDPGQVKDVVKGIKRRIGSKHSKIQLLALTLLETIIKNCGDIVHMHVAEKDILHDMVKIVKKKPGFQVKQKILILIDTWQEAFGGPRARYPQYYSAYQELLRAGAVFPPRSERSAPVFTPPQSHPLASYSQNVRSSEHNRESSRDDPSAEPEFPTLCLSEIQSARGSMDVLAEMLSAVDPGNKEGLRQEALLDLVEQCRMYKQRVVHLVNSTSDESLLCQGLALNDDLQRVLAKYESLVSGRGALQEKPKHESSASDHINVGSSLVDAGESSKQAAERSAPGSNTYTQSSIPAPPDVNGSVVNTKVDPKVDLLSGDLLGGDDLSLTKQNSLALVPVSDPQPSSPVASDQNALALVDMFSNAPNPSNGHPTPLTGPEFQMQQQLQQQQQLQPQHSPFYQNGFTTGVVPPYEQQNYQQQISSPTWGAQSIQQPSSPAYGAQNGGVYPPPPWELQSVDNQSSGSPYSPTMQLSAMGGPQSPRMQGGQLPLGLPTPGNDQVVGMFVQPVTGGQLSAINQSFQMSQPNVYPQQQQMQGGGGQQHMMTMLPQAMQASHMASMYPSHMYGNQPQMGSYGYGGGGGYGYQQDPQYLDQRMYGLSMKDETVISRSSSTSSMASYLPPMKQQPAKGDDKLFGDLVDIAKLKPKSTTPSRTGSV